LDLTQLTRLCLPQDIGPLRPNEIQIITQLTRLKQLQSLQLSYAYLTREGIDALSQLTALTALTLKNKGFWWLAPSILFPEDQNPLINHMLTIRMKSENKNEKVRE
jgi:hypothetical protein